MNQLEERQQDGTWKTRVKLGSENQGFSGIDLRTQANFPGVVYPLNIGHEIPSFSSIIAHINKKAKVVHSEYRLFIGTENEKTYIKGRCATLVRGYEPEILPRVVQPSPILPKLIDKIFDLIPVQPEKIIQKEAIPMPSYILRNELESSEGTEFLHGLSKAWDETIFEPDTDFIKKENIVEKVHKVNVLNKYVNQSLYDDYDDYRYGGYQQKKDKEVKKDNKPDLWDKKLYIIKEEYSTWTELYRQSNDDIDKLYEEILELKEEEEYEDEIDSIEYENEIEENNSESINYYTVLYNGNAYNSDQLTKIRFLLEEEEYLSFAKINQMTDYNILAYYENFYQAKTKGN